MGSAASAAEKRKMLVIFSPVRPERPLPRVFPIPRPTFFSWASRAYNFVSMMDVI